MYIIRLPSHIIVYAVKNGKNINISDVKKNMSLMYTLRKTTRGVYIIIIKIKILPTERV